MKGLSKKKIFIIKISAALLILPSFFFYFISTFFKKKNNKNLIFLQDRNSIIPNIRLEKILLSLNKRNIYPILLIDDKKYHSFNKLKKNFKKIYTYKNYYELLIFSLKNNSDYFHFFTESELTSGLVVRLTRPGKFFFDNYDQIFGIHNHSNIINLIIERFLILNSFNICRSAEIKILKNKKIKHIFFPEYISKILVTPELIEKKKSKTVLNICYGGKLKESSDWGKSTYDHNHDEVINRFGKFKKINLHLFPSAILSEKSKKDYKNLWKNFKNVYFHNSLDHKSISKKLKIWFWSYNSSILNESANMKSKYSMANKLLIMSCGLTVIYPTWNIKNTLFRFQFIHETL